MLSIVVTKYFSRLLDQSKQPTHELQTTREPPRYPSGKGKKLLRPDEIVNFGESCKLPKFFNKPPLSGAKKHPDFQVTLWLHFVTTNINFAYIESE